MLNIAELPKNVGVCGFCLFFLTSYVNFYFKIRMSLLIPVCMCIDRIHTDSIYKCKTLTSENVSPYLF